MARKESRPTVRPITRIELSESNIRLRVILLGILILVAVVAIGMAIYYGIQDQPGWMEVKTTCDEPNYSSEFAFMYDFSKAGDQAMAVNRGVIQLYSTAMEDAYRIFSKDASTEQIYNLYFLNNNYNRNVTIDPALYRALELLDSYDNRSIFLAPVYAEYDRVLRSESDVEASEYDPSKNPEAKAYLDALMTFVRDPEAINLQLLGDNQVCLQVSEEYLAFAQEQEITEFLDFGWMRNAFVADYIANLLLDAGYDDGYLESVDGFHRSLSDVGALQKNIYHRQGKDIYIPGTMTCSGKLSMVALRDYPLSTLDRWAYYVYEDGRIVSNRVNPETGDCRMAAAELVSYSGDLSCAGLLLEMLPIVFAEDLDEDALNALREQGIYSVWCEKLALCYNQQDLPLETRENEGGLLFEKRFVS